EQGLSLFSEIVNMVKDEVIGQQQVVVCSPFIHLSSIAKLSADLKNVAVGAQNIHQAASGAYTGEISASQVKSVSAVYVILVHSEFRAYLGVADVLLSQKTDIALKNGLTKIISISRTE